MIAIVDYGLGNIKAFSNVYKKLNIDCVYADTPEQLQRATKIILPGVGAFDYAMETLNSSGLRETLDDMVLNQKVPVVGICVGMQMMANSSDEGSLKGLGWIPGTVKKFDFLENENPLPLPHMGWNNLVLDVEDPLFKGLEADPRFYYLHSYYFKCKNQENSIASAKYGLDFSCIVRRENIYGIQCHPEKSHHNGSTILKNFSEL
ncbi:imidazole glycerol phosphate synthase subunit HisH [Glaciecola sp. MF2-115]|uniref:imidazole glycerol phosphate synthase subunit HisH n=1 Tax=Glaciecola sp. MF2-115 TaxID=3384827 RepID=UPI0039A1B7A2